MEKEKRFVGKREAMAMAGVAVLMMVWHHLFLFPNWLSPGVEWHTGLGYPGRLATMALANFGNMCVQIFAMTSGIALCVNEKAFSSWRLRGKRLAKFLGAYWLVSAIFLLIGWINGYELPDAHMLVTNMFGVNTGPGTRVSVPFAWYVCFYVEFIVLSPLLVMLLRGKRARWIYDALIFFLTAVAVGALGRIKLPGGWNSFFIYLNPLVSLVLGYLAAKHRLFERLYARIGRFCSATVCVLADIALILFRYRGLAFITAPIESITGSGGGYFIDYQSNNRIPLYLLHNSRH